MIQIHQILYLSLHLISQTFYLQAVHPIAANLPGICKFANERQWSRFHTPRNLIMALTGELGELSELLQWKGDDLNMKLTEDELQKVGQELADVTIYLLRLAHVCNVSIDEHTLQVCLDKNPS